ncbi:MAG: hypothetical protein V4683_18260 [Bacteroidota bacterium]
MYHIYPTLLNTFSLFSRKVADVNGALFVNFKQMIASINRDSKPVSDPQQKGINFENAVITGKGEEAFPELILDKIRAKMPAKYKTQVFTKFVVQNVEIYGYVDVLGEGRAIDLKTTSSYQPGKYSNNFQNLYLLGLRNKGISQLDYLVTDFKEVYVESYHIKQFNFNPMLEEIEKFTKFLELNKGLISDRKIFGEDNLPKALPLFPNF